MIGVDSAGSAAPGIVPIKQPGRACRPHRLRQLFLGGGYALWAAETRCLAAGVPLFFDDGGPGTWMVFGARLRGGVELWLWGLGAFLSAVTGKSDFVSANTGAGLNPAADFAGTAVADPDLPAAVDFASEQI